MDRIIPYSRPKQDLHQKALDLIDEGNIPAALGAFALAYDEDPGDEYLAADYAQCLYAEQCYDESLELLVLAEHYSPEPLPELYYAMACNYLGMGRYFEADGFLAQFMAAGPCPEYAEALEDATGLCQSLGRIQAMGETAFQWMEQADRRAAEGEYGQAETLVRQAMAAETDNIIIRQRLINMYMEQERPGDALREALATLEDHPDYIPLAAQVTLIYYLLEDLQNAALRLEKLATLAAAQGEAARVVVMRVTRHLRGPKRAWEYVKQAKLNMSCNRAVLHEAALYAVEAGEPQAAKECWERIRQINPLDIQAKVFTEWTQFDDNLGDSPLFPAKLKARLEETEYRDGFLPPNSPGAPGLAAILGHDYSLPPPMAEAMLASVLEELQPITQALGRWHTQPAFRERVRWAMNNAGETQFQQICNFLLAAGDDRAEAVLRRFLVGTDTASAFPLDEEAMPSPAAMGQGRAESPGGERRQALCEHAVNTLRHMGSRGPYVILREGFWMTLSRRPRRERRPRRGDPYRIARGQAVEASSAQWGDEGRVAAESLFRAMLLEIGWPAPSLNDWEALSRGVIAAAAVRMSAYDAFNIITGTSPAADYWCRRVLRANAGYYNIDMLL
ncbi:MAG: hypothetical protein FWD16_03775 [Clostridia bacterium]|nr:hypothetical protein [Clostridia bacterium]